MSEGGRPRRLNDVGDAVLGFQEKKDYELDRLSDEELIAYLVRARRASNEAAAELALAIFAHRHFDDLARKARKKLPSWADAEDCAQQAIEGTLKAAFRGELAVEALGLLYRILARRVADFHRDRERKPPPDALPEDRDDDYPHADVATEAEATDLVDTVDVIERVVSTRSPEHRMVIDDYVFDGYDATETAARVNDAFPGLNPTMSDQNVHQIASRFRKDLRAALEESS